MLATSSSPSTESVRLLTKRLLVSPLSIIVVQQAGLRKSAAKSTCPLVVCSGVSKLQVPLIRTAARRQIVKRSVVTVQGLTVDTYYDEVRDVKDKRMVNGILQYKVSWVHEDEGDSTLILGSMSRV